MNKEALFCDGTQYYVIPQEPSPGDKVTFWFRTAKDDVTEVNLLTGGSSYAMEKSLSEGLFDFYSIVFLMPRDLFVYSFHVKSEEETCYYNRCGVAGEVVPFYDFKISPGFYTPDWAKGAVMYQIYVDRFYNGDPSNDVENGEYHYIGDYSAKVTDWNQYPATTMGIREFYGGDLQGVIDKLDYLQELGVEVLYLNPIFVSPSNHKYDIQDYDHVDPHYGKIVKDGGENLTPGDTDNSHATKYQKRVTDWENLDASNQLLITLVTELHKRDMKIILDGVFNHCGSFNKWMDRERIYEGQLGYEPGAYVSAQSPYRKFFGFNKNEDSDWPYNTGYDGWWGHDTLPKLNYEESRELEDYIIEIGKKWVSPPYNVDGWRLDVAADLGHTNAYNHYFWKRFRKAVRDANPNALILAEHYGNPSDWLQGDEWDSVMNYDAFMEPVTWFLTGLEKHSDENRPDLYNNADNFRGAMNHHMAGMFTPSLQVAMNELSNHDHSRFLTRTNHMVGRVDMLGSEAASQFVSLPVMRIAVAMQMTWVGAPTVYYGDEAGVCGFTDPDNRRTYPWGRENQDLIQYHKELIRIHKNEDALCYGSLRMLCGENGVLAYGRFTTDDRLIIIVNNRNDLVKVDVPVWETGVPMETEMSRILYSYDDGYTTNMEVYLVRNGHVVVNMGKQSVLILKEKKY